MSPLELATQQIDKLVGSQGVPYPVFNKKWLKHGGIMWNFQPALPSADELNALKAIYREVSQPLLTQGISDWEQFLQKVKDESLAKAAHLSPTARQFMVETLLFQGDYNGLSHMVDADRVFAEVASIADRLSLWAYKTQLFMLADDRTEYRQI